MSVLRMILLISSSLLLPTFAPVANADDAFSEQVILVTVAKGLERQFIEDTYRLGAIPGVISVRIARPETRSISRERMMRIAPSASIWR